MVDGNIFSFLRISALFPSGVRTGHPLGGSHQAEAAPAAALNGGLAADEIHV